MKADKNRNNGRHILPVTILLCAVFSFAQVQAQNLTLNMKEVEIETLIQMVSETTKKNFVVDQRVKGKVTVISASPMSEEEFYQVFLSVLSVHGYAAVPSGNVVKIVPQVEAKSRNMPVQTGKVGSTGEEMVTQIMELRYANAAQLIPILRPLVPQEAHIAAHAEKNILIISDRADNVARLRQIIQRIDQPESNEIDVVVLQHAGAAEVSRLLESLNPKQAAGTANPSQQTAVVADPRTNSILISGERDERLRIKALVMHLDTPLKTVGNTRVVYLRYAQAADLMTVLQNISDSMDKTTQGNAQQPVQQGEKRLNVKTNIQADESTNSLIITAAPDSMRDLLKVIEKLDIRRSQILVEAVIAEIESNVAKELGVQWAVDGSPNGTGPVGLVNFGSPGGGLVDLAGSVISGAVPALGNGALLGVGRFNDDSLNFAILLRALAGDSGTNVLSTPSLMTLDNQEAEIVVGRNVPFITGQYTNTGAAAGSASPFQTIQREDIGIKLKVKPQINEADVIKLHIEQEVSSLVPTSLSGGASDLITSTRKIKTVVMVDDGKLIVLGGLIDEELTDTAQKVPGLGDLPLIGGLFRYQEARKQKRNLMVFMRPLILRDSKTQTAVTNSKYGYMRSKQLDYRRTGVAFTESNEIPVLPDLDDFLTVLPGNNGTLQ